MLEKTIDSKLVYHGRIMDVYKDDVELSDGAKSVREVVKKPNAVGIIALRHPELVSGSHYLKDSAMLWKTRHFARLATGSTAKVVNQVQHDVKVIMVKQFRYAVNEAMLEIPAGKIDEGETPLECAKRELEEETGYLAQNWQSLGFVYVSAGFTNEKIHLFFAENLTYKQAKPDAGEILECYEYPLQDVFDMINSGEINDAKTICALARAFK